MRGYPLDYIADPKLANGPKETDRDGEHHVNLSKDLHKGEDELKKMFEHDTGLKFDKVG